MADTKISALTAMTTPVDADLLPVVDDPAGTPATQRLTFSNSWTNYYKGKADALYQPLDSDLTSIAALSTTAYGRGFLVYADEAGFKAGVNLEVGTDVLAYDADVLFADVGDALTAGFLSDSYSGGTISSGTYTPAPATGQENFQHIVNGGAFTLAPPASPCSVVLEITNNGSAGTITTSGFTAVDGDAFTTVNGDDFMCFITKTQNFSYLSVKALQ